MDAFYPRFQFLGIPTKGELRDDFTPVGDLTQNEFPISRDPHKGGTFRVAGYCDSLPVGFPISRDPHKGGTCV